MAKKARPIALDESDRRELERLQRSPSTPAGLSRRARAVLLMVQDVAGTEIARLTGYTPVQISRIRRRFSEEGVCGLPDKPRSGRPKAQRGQEGPHRRADPAQSAARTHGAPRSLYAALEVASGKVVGGGWERHTGADFLRLLKRLHSRHRGHALRVILDNPSTHTTPRSAWLAAHPQGAAPVHARGGFVVLNMVEAWFGILTRKSVRLESFPSVKALARHIRVYVDHRNEHPSRSSGPRNRSQSSAKRCGGVVNVISRTRR
jgi:hypothetical protein